MAWVRWPTSISRCFTTIAAALDERLDVLRWDQLYPVAHRAKRSSPVIGSRAGFESYLNLPSPNLTTKNDLLSLINAVQREDMLRRVNRYPFEFHGPVLS